MTIDLARTIRQGAAAVDARDNSLDPAHRANHMNASEADSCIRRQWYAKNTPEAAQGEEIPNGFMLRGRGVEAYAVEALRAANAEIHYAGDEQRSLVMDRISVTPDGLYVERWEDDEGEVHSRFRALEIKSFDPRSNVSAFPRAPHVTQVQIAADALDQQLREEAAITDPEEAVAGGLLVYINASDWFDIHVFEVPRMSETQHKELQARAKRLLTAKDVARLDREGQRLGECSRCPFQKVCGGSSAARGRTYAAPVKTTRKGTQLHTAVVDYVAADAMEKEAKALKTDLKETILQELTSRKTKSLDVDGYTVSVSERAGSTTVDRKAAKAAGLDLTPFEKVGRPTTALSVKQKQS